MEIRAAVNVTPGAINHEESMNTITVWDRIALVLVIIGAINWGLVGLFRFDLVAAIFGADSIPARVIYVLVGLAGLWCLSLLFRTARAVRDSRRTVVS
jgi:uncharacterized protein